VVGWCNPRTGPARHTQKDTIDTLVFLRLTFSRSRYFAVGTHRMTPLVRGRHVTAASSRITDPASSFPPRLLSSLDFWPTAGRECIQGFPALYISNQTNRGRDLRMKTDMGVQTSHATNVVVSKSKIGEAETSLLNTNQIPAVGLRTCYGCCEFRFLTCGSHILVESVKLDLVETSRPLEYNFE
jgi:hypothetical protein